MFFICHYSFVFFEYYKLKEDLVLDIQNKALVEILILALYFHNIGLILFFLAFCMGFVIKFKTKFGYIINKQEELFYYEKKTSGFPYKF